MPLANSSGPRFIGGRYRQPRRGDCPDRQSRRLHHLSGPNRFVAGNLDRALTEEPRPGAERKLTGKEEALLVATACAKPPAGRRRWTLALLADAMVKLPDHDSLSGETGRRRLADNDLKPWRRDMWRIPHVDGESQQTKLAPNWAAPIQACPKTQNHCDELLDRFRAKWIPVRVKKTRQKQESRAPVLIQSEPEML